MEISAFLLGKFTLSLSESYVNNKQNESKIFTIWQILLHSIFPFGIMKWNKNPYLVYI